MRSRAAFHGLGYLVIVATVFQLTAGAVSATHSVPFPRWWWDKDNDGLAEAADSQITYQRAGTGWTTARISRSDEADSEWAGQTDWNPLFQASSTNDVYADGRQPSCVSWEPGDLGMTCRLGVRKNAGTPIEYWDLTDTDIFMNTANVTFNSNYDQGSSGNFSFGGILTHELGHGARLIDLYGTSCGGSDVYTMCGAVTVAQSYALQTLRADDINAANLLYLP